MRSLSSGPKGGRAPNLEREAWADRLGIELRKRPAKQMPNWLMRQLCSCRSDEARRLILGVSQ